MNTATTYMGMDLVSPIVLTDAIPDAELLLPMEEAGAGAVVLRPLLEEEIIWDIKLNQREKAPTSNYGINLDYIAERMPKDYVQQYLEQIATLKQRLSIPVIAAIDCYSFDSWFSHLQKLTEADCDAIELNIQLQPFHPSVDTNTVSQFIENVTTVFKRVSSLPMSLKISSHFTDMVYFTQQLSWMGVKNITLFNDGLSLDIDLQQQQLVSDIRPHLTSDTLFWTTLCRPNVYIDLSSVVANGEEAIKALLVGATTVHISHCNGRTHSTDIQSAHTVLHQWMQKYSYNNIAAFRGRLVPSDAIKNYHAVRNLYIRGLKEQREESSF